ncbi:MAG: hypothetical protein AABN33_18425 [Acidobacteriota bacterium]
MATKTKWSRWLRIAIPFVHVAALEVENLDDNDEGPDDQAAAGIAYCADVLQAIVDKKDIPYPPDGLFERPPVPTEEAVR